MFFLIMLFFIVGWWLVDQFWWLVDQFDGD